MCSRGHFLRSTFSALNSVVRIAVSVNLRYLFPGKAHAFSMGAMCDSFGGL